MEALVRQRIGVADVRMRHFLELCYIGQDFSLAIPVDPARYAENYAATVRHAFHQVHETRFGYHDADLALEIVNAHLAAMAPRTVDALPAPTRREGPALVGRRAVIFEADAVACPVYRRDSLASAERIDGPAIIQEYRSIAALFPQNGAEVTASS